MKNKVRKEIGNALSETTYAYNNNNGQIQCVKATEFDIARIVCRIENLTCTMIQSSAIEFSVKTNKYTKGTYLHATKFGQNVLNELKVDIRSIKRHFPFHRFNPYVELFMRNSEDRHLFELPWIISTLSNKDVVMQVDVLNGFIDAIRKEGNSKKFKTTMAEFKRLANKNYRELLLYTDALFDEYARLLVIRLDLGYLKKHCWPLNLESSVTHLEVKKHWKNMLSYLSTKLPNDCFAGFAYKLEYGLEKNFHFHILVFLDGSKVREDATIARLIGEHWNKNITAGKGLYFNCNAIKLEYKSCGIGMINHSDTEVRENFKVKVATYLTKTDYYIKLVAPGNGRTFGKGNMPKPKISKLGRPRIKTKLESGEI